jgi:DNA-binding NarL/FixJ family response regulator
MGSPLRACARSDYERLVGSIRGALGGLAFARETNTGRALTTADAVALALALAPSAASDRGGPESGSGEDAPLSSRSTAPAGLSPRQREVLRLVAAGQTNREIARILVLSEKTVARHVSNIFDKLDVTTRSAATAVALREGLA